ncbi:unnamed protein product, partial [Amoebophrya sp. A120]|eukprot:GSA120T00020072001.1
MSHHIKANFLASVAVLKCWYWCGLLLSLLFDARTSWSTSWQHHPCFPLQQATALSSSTRSSTGDSSKKKNRSNRTAATSATSSSAEDAGGENCRAQQISSGSHSKKNCATSTTTSPTSSSLANRSQSTKPDRSAFLRAIRAQGAEAESRVCRSSSCSDDHNRKHRYDNRVPIASTRRAAGPRPVVREFLQVRLQPVGKNGVPVVKEN